MHDADKEIDRVADDMTDAAERIRQEVARLAEQLARLKHLRTEYRLGQLSKENR